MKECLIFVDEDTPQEGLNKVQIQMRGIWVTLTAVDLAFARRVLEFVAETRDNPLYMDTHIGGGRYRRMPEKSIDLSSSFLDAQVTLAKDGEFGDRYDIALHSSFGFNLGIQLNGAELDALVGGMQEIVDDYCDPPGAPGSSNSGHDVDSN